MPTNPAESRVPDRTGSEAYTAEGKDMRDELSLALARQRELETERDEAIAASEAWERKAVERMFNIVAAETRQRELEEALRAFDAAVVADLRAALVGRTHDQWERARRAGLRDARAHFQQHVAALLSPPTQNGAPGRPVPPHGSGP